MECWMCGVKPTHCMLQKLDIVAPIPARVILTCHLQLCRRGSVALARTATHSVAACSLLLFSGTMVLHYSLSELDLVRASKPFTLQERPWLVRVLTWCI